MNNYDEARLLELISEYTLNQINGDVTITIQTAKDFESTNDINTSAFFEINPIDIEAVIEVEQRENLEYIIEGINYLYVNGKLDKIKNIYKIINIRLQEYESFMEQNKDLFLDTTKLLNIEILNSIKKELMSYIKAIGGKIKEAEKIQVPFKIINIDDFFDFMVWGRIIDRSQKKNLECFFNPNFEGKLMFKEDVSKNRIMAIFERLYELANAGKVKGKKIVFKTFLEYVNQNSNITLSNKINVSKSSSNFLNKMPKIQIEKYKA